MNETMKKLQNLTNEQKKELNALTTAEEVAAFAKQSGIELTAEEAAQIAAALPDDALDGVTGGTGLRMPPPDNPTLKHLPTGPTIDNAPVSIDPEQGGAMLPL